MKIIRLQCFPFFSLLTFGISSSRHQIVQSTVVPETRRILTLSDRSDQVPDKVLDLLIALVALQAVQQLKARESTTTGLVISPLNSLSLCLNHHKIVVFWRESQKGEKIG